MNSRTGAVCLRLASGANTVLLHGDDPQRGVCTPSFNHNAGRLILIPSPFPSFPAFLLLSQASNILVRHYHEVVEGVLTPL